MVAATATGAFQETPDTGLVDLVLEVKKYVKSLFGASSPQIKQVIGLPFKKPKK